MQQSHLDYEPPPVKRTLGVLAAHMAILTAAVIAVNVMLFALAKRGAQNGAFDNGAGYLIAIGPANVVVALVSVACTPLVKRLTGGAPARAHIALSIAVPAIATIGYAIVLMSNAP